MAGLSAKLPLYIGAPDGHGLNQTHKELVNQNFRMLILTAPGERMMDPLFGVGLRNYLFELDSPFVRSNITEKIGEQVNRYMPFIELNDISFISPEEDDRLDTNFLGITIKYTIVPLQQSDLLDITL
jgi:phage baseplate assembly protein W